MCHTVLVGKAKAPHGDTRQPRYREAEGVQTQEEPESSTHQSREAHTEARSEHLEAGRASHSYRIKALTVRYGTMAVPDSSPPALPVAFAPPESVLGDVDPVLPPDPWVWEPPAAVFGLVCECAPADPVLPVPAEALDPVVTPAKWVCWTALPAGT